MGRDALDKLIRERLHYDPTTGIIYWTATGQPAGGLNNGYHRVKICGKTIHGHRIAWFLVTGEWPKMVDHKNRIRSDNRWSNLRATTFRTNAANAIYPDKSGLPRGVRKVKYGRYQARLGSDNSTRNLGTFDTPELASEAYESAFNSRYGAEWRPDGHETTITN